MSKQEIFDIVAAHLLAQRAVSTCAQPGFDGCAYRGDDGMKCAIGVLIPDKLYSPQMEGQQVQHLPAEVRAHLGADKQDMLDFLCALQGVHDDASIRNWHQSLNEVAGRWTLQGVA